MKSILRDEKGRFIKDSHVRTEFKKGFRYSTKTEFKKGLIPWNKGKTNVYSKEVRERMSKSHNGLHRSIETKRKLSKANRMENHPQWQGGISFEPYTSEFNIQLKELIRQRDNYQCQLCGMPEIENIRKLDIHHIDYNKKNCLPNNLITLCRSCNAKVNANREYWTEYFRNKMERD